MNTQNRTTITSAIVSTAFFAVLLVAGLVMVAEAAPYQDYFTDIESDTSFTDWFESQGDTTLTACDTFNTVFSTNCGSRETQDSTSNFAAVGAALDGNSEDETQEQTAETAQDESESVAVSITAQRCVDEDGVVEFDFENVDSYELTISGDVYEVADIDNEEVDFQTQADLPDGPYVMSVYNGGENDSVSFTVDCDETTSDPDSLTASCNVTPSNPEIDEVVTWNVQANGGSGSYDYEWTGDASGNTATVETSYGSAGEKEAFAAIDSGSEFLTTRCAVEVQEGEVEVQSTQQGRTIEEF